MNTLIPSSHRLVSSPVTSNNLLKLCCRALRDSDGKLNRFYPSSVTATRPEMLLVRFDLQVRLYGSLFT